MPDNGPDPESEGSTETQRNHKFRPVWLSDVVIGNLCMVAATPLWVVGGALLNGRPKPIATSWGFIFVGICFFAFAVRFWMVNHRKRQAKHKIPEYLPNLLCCFVILCGIAVSIFAVSQEEQSRPDPNALVISPTRIELSDGEWSKVTPTDIFNPNDFPIYDLMLKFVINGKGVGAESLIIEQGEQYQNESSSRADYVGVPNGQIVFYWVPGIPAREHIQFNISGSITAKSSADVSVWHFTKEPSGMRYKNGATPKIIPPTGMIMFPGFSPPIPGLITHIDFHTTNNVLYLRLTINNTNLIVPK